MVNKKYLIRMSWGVSAQVTVTARDMKEAISFIEDIGALPEGGEYIEGSFEVHKESSREKSDL